MVDLIGTALNGAVTLSAAFGGFWLAGRNQRAGDVRAADREREQHGRDVATRLAEERHRDQLALLRTLQEEVQEVTRNTSRIIQWDESLVRLSADSSLLPPGLNVEDHDARVRLKMHSSRVLDDGIRDAVDRFTQEAVALTMPTFLDLHLNLQQAEAEGLRRLTALEGVATPTLDLVGETLRAEAAWTPTIGG